MYRAILLVGPTGSGKTPLGQFLEKKGLSGMPCLHFDFGDALRASVKGQTGVLTPGERRVVEESLRTGALLEDEHFPIAEKLLTAHVTQHSGQGDIVVVLNGLPRHAGQAAAMEAVVKMQAVVSLECSPAVALERIRLDSGGDRGGRHDDTLPEVERRIELFRNRTAPLLRYYGERGVPVLPVDVRPMTTAREMRAQLEAKWPHRSNPGPKRLHR